MNYNSQSPSLTREQGKPSLAKNNSINGARNWLNLLRPIASSSAQHRFGKCNSKRKEKKHWKPIEYTLEKFATFLFDNAYALLFYTNDPVLLFRPIQTFESRKLPLQGSKTRKKNK